MGLFNETCSQLRPLLTSTIGGLIIGTVYCIMMFLSDFDRRVTFITLPDTDGIKITLIKSRSRFGCGTRSDRQPAQYYNGQSTGNLCTVSCVMLFCLLLLLAHISTVCSR